MLLLRARADPNLTCLEDDTFLGPKLWTKVEGYLTKGTLIFKPGRESNMAGKSTQIYIYIYISILI